MAWYWLAGIRPANTSASVPRDTPVASVRIWRTSLAEVGEEDVDGRATHRVKPGGDGPLGHDGWGWATSGCDDRGSATAGCDGGGWATHRVRPGGDGPLGHDGWGSVSLRISPRPGASVQKARASDMRSLEWDVDQYIGAYAMH